MQTKPNPIAHSTIHPRRSSGFTLVELLVVIAIIAVLATVIAAVAMNSINNARKSTCVSNLRQIGTLMNGHAAEHNGFYPAAGKPVGYVSRLCESMFPDSFPARDQGSDADREKFFRLSKNSMFICPADKDGLKNLEKSYLANGRITGVLETENPDTYVGGGTNAFTPKPIAKVYDPARTFLLIEGWEKKNTLWNANDVRYTSEPETVANFDAHKGGRHYLFVDGHVDWFVKDPGRENSRNETIYYKGQNPDA